MLAAFSAEGRFWRGNLHGHSTKSDGRFEPEDVCRRYREHGYDFIALTDHFLEDYGFPITDTRPLRPEGFTTILGAEVHAQAISSGMEWHILAVGLPVDFPATGPGETGPELAARCREAGAFIALAHPHWYQLTLEDALTIESAHAVEVYNHTCALETDRGDGLVMLDSMLSAGRPMNAIATDDSHGWMPDAFGGWVMVKAAANEPGALLDALKAGAFYASRGPEIHDIQVRDDALEIRCSPAIGIMAVGKVRDSETIHGETLTAARLSLRKFKGSWCRVVVIDAAGRRAWTNPLWL